MILRSYDQEAARILLKIAEMPNGAIIKINDREYEVTVKEAIA
jgi:hypothetical protein